LQDSLDSGLRLALFFTDPLEIGIDERLRALDKRGRHLRETGRHLCGWASVRHRLECGLEQLVVGEQWEADVGLPRESEGRKHGEKIREGRGRVKGGRKGSERKQRPGA
jgi:hypothetical protein